MFQKGDVVDLVGGGRVEILDKLGEGGQGIVYKVLLDGKEYALKWYTNSAISNNDTFYKNLKVNINSGSPSAKFLWPLYLTQKQNGSYGYIKNLRPAGYNEFSEFLVAKKVFFDSHVAQINAAINITEAFRDLHRKGYSYQDLNDGNFFINSKSGDVLICDNDNVAANGENLGVKGKARYMAPEIVRNISSPDKYSDYFSLAVILFELMFFSHPLEGERVIKHPCLTEEIELKLYGKEPIFIFDPQNNANRPVDGVHNNAITFWKKYPEFIKDIFRKAFSYKAMDSNDLDAARHKRVIDNDWRKAFVSLRSMLVMCPGCSNELFLNMNGETKCTNKKCSRTIQKLNWISFLDDKYKIPIYPGVKIYKCMTDDLSDDISTVVGEISTHPTKPGVLGLKNNDILPWEIVLKDGSFKMLEPGKNISIGTIAEIKFKRDCLAKIIN